jgi:hypothetical protein
VAPCELAGVELQQEQAWCSGSCPHNRSPGSHPSAHALRPEPVHSCGEALQALAGKVHDIVRSDRAQVLEAEDRFSLTGLGPGTIGRPWLGSGDRKLRVEPRQIVRSDLLGLLKRPCVGQTEFNHQAIEASCQRAVPLVLSPVETGRQSR